MKVSASVVVCAYTIARWGDIVQGLGAVAAQDPSPAELILVIDHNDDLYERAKADLPAMIPGLQVVASDQPAGLSGARNTGVLSASGDVIVFLDDDACPRDGWLQQLLTPFEDPLVMVTGGRAVPRWPAGRPSWFPYEFDWVVGCSYRGLPTQRAEVRNVIGVSMAVRRDVFARVGFFADGVGRTAELPLGCEETELCIRIRSAEPNARILYVPLSVVDHRVSNDRPRLRYFVRRCLAEGISKAQITAMSGSGAATSSERAYAARTLPAGAAREIFSVVYGHPGGLTRAAMIFIGFCVTAIGFLSELAKMTASRQLSFRAKPKEQ